MSELTKATSTFQLQLRSPAIFLGILLRLFALAMGFFTFMVIDILISVEELPWFFEVILFCLCLFVTSYLVEQLLVNDCEVTATQQGIQISIAKPVLLLPRSTILLGWEDILVFKSGNIRYGKKTRPFLIIHPVVGYKLRFMGDATFSLATHLRRYLPGKERPLKGVWL